MCEFDLDQVMQIESRAYSHPWTHGIFTDCLQVGYECWMYFQDEALVGYSVFSVAVGEAHLLNLCVAPDFQGLGIGRQVLADLIRRCKTQGAETLFLEVRASNQAAINLYLSQGFQQIGQRPGYYPALDKREDALVFALGLG